MNEMDLNDEIAKVQEKMKGVEKESKEYAELIRRLKELEELKRYHNHEDPETIRAEAEQQKAVDEADAEAERIKATKIEAAKDRRVKILAIGIKGVSCLALIFLSQFLSQSGIMDKGSEKFVDWMDKFRPDSE